MDRILAILPVSIAGRIIIENIIAGFKYFNYQVDILDELKNEKIENYKNFYSYIIGYDYSPIKLKIDNNLNFPCIAYFADEFHLKTAGIGYDVYSEYLKNKDIFVFSWDRDIAKEENCFYLPLFVDFNLYKEYSFPINDIAFLGRLDTDIRLNTFLELNKKLKNYTFEWYAIEKHYLDALNRCNLEEKEIIKKTYRGFVDNSVDIARAISKSKIIYNINSQGKSSVNFRTIETLACRRLLISDYRKELDLFNNLVPIYYDIKDLKEKIEYYLKNKQEYDIVVNACYEITKKNHSSIVAVKKILDCIKSNIKK